MSALERQYTNESTPGGELVRLSDWQAEQRGDAGSRADRLKREAEARRRAELIFERGQLPWWRRLALGFLDLFR